MFLDFFLVKQDSTLRMVLADSDTSSLNYYDKELLASAVLLGFGFSIVSVTWN